MCFHLDTSDTRTGACFLGSPRAGPGFEFRPPFCLARRGTSGGANKRRSLARAVHFFQLVTQTAPLTRKPHLVEAFKEVVQIGPLVDADIGELFSDLLFEVLARMAASMEAVETEQASMGWALWEAGKKDRFDETGVPAQRASSPNSSSPSSNS